MTDTFKKREDRIYFVTRVANSLTNFVKNHGKFLVYFFTGQFMLQSLNLLNGFFLLRWLSIPEQAKFSLALGIQNLIITLSDLGFTGSIVALTGDRFNDKSLVTKYIYSARKLRNYLFVFACLISAAFIPFILQKQGWNFPDLAFVLIPVLLSVFWQADCSLYDSTLVMQKRIKELYKPQIGISTLKLLTNFLLQISNSISALSTLILNAIALFINGKIFKSKAAPYLDLSVDKFDEESKVMLRYLKPLFPSLVFNAFYGQIQIFLISLFGKTTNIAEVAALGRIAQIFLFLGALNATIISPFIARTGHTTLKRNYLIILGVSLGIGGLMIVTSVVFPEFYLFLMGPRYQHLGNEIRLMIMNASLSYIGNVMWTMNSARKWIFWWGTWSYLICVTMCQIFGIMYFNISTTHGVLKISGFTLLVLLLVHAQTSIIGFYRDRNNKLLKSFA